MKISIDRNDPGVCGVGAIIMKEKGYNSAIHLSLLFWAVIILLPGTEYEYDL